MYEGQLSRQKVLDNVTLQGISYHILVKIWLVKSMCDFIVTFYGYHHILTFNFYLLIVTFSPVIHLFFSLCFLHLHSISFSCLRILDFYCLYEEIIFFITSSVDFILVSFRIVFQNCIPLLLLNCIQ